MYCVFKCMHGLGNRLCNIMNMFYIHQKYPQTQIFLLWIENEHCRSKLTDLFDFSGDSYKWILDPREYHRKLFPKHRRQELWASTSNRCRTRWDNIDEWAKHAALVSVSFHLYQFVSCDFCIQTFQSFRVRESVTSLLQEKIRRFGVGRELIHVRTGDLLVLLKHENASVESNIQAKKKVLCDKYPNHMVFDYNQLVVNRDHTHMIDSLSDLLFFSKHCALRAYSPYSWFSSWVYLLSPCFDAKHPIFDTYIVDIVELQGLNEADVKPP